MTSFAAVKLLAYTNGHLLYACAIAVFPDTLENLYVSCQMVFLDTNQECDMTSAGVFTSRIHIMHSFSIYLSNHGNHRYDPASAFILTIF